MQSSRRLKYYSSIYIENAVIVVLIQCDSLIMHWLTFGSCTHRDVLFKFLQASKSNLKGPIIHVIVFSWRDDKDRQNQKITIKFEFSSDLHNFLIKFFIRVFFYIFGKLKAQRQIMENPCIKKKQQGFQWKAVILCLIKTL